MSCLRHAFWSQKTHKEQFKKDSHYDKYLLSDNQVDIYNIFLSQPDSMIFSSLSDDFISYVKSGLNFLFEEHTKSLWNYISLSIFEGSFELKLAYSPLVQKEVTLENMVKAIPKK